MNPSPEASGRDDASTAAAVLAERIRAGDAAAEARLVEKYGRGVALILDRHTGGRPEAEDLFQDTFRVVFQKLRRGELREPEKLPGFVVAIARNLAIEFYRKAARRRTDPDSETVRMVASGGADQFDRLEALERAALVRQVMKELPVPRDREILHRFYIDEEAKESISADFELTSLQFNRVLHRARQRYKILYRQHLAARQGPLLSLLVAVGLPGGRMPAVPENIPRSGG